MCKSFKDKPNSVSHKRTDQIHHMFYAFIGNIRGIITTMGRITDIEIIQPAVKFFKENPPLHRSNKVPIGARSLRVKKTTKRRCN